MLTPSGWKYRKFRKVIPCGKVVNAEVQFGMFGIKATEPCRINSKQIESARKMLARVVKKTGRIWIRIFPHLPVTKKPADVRMGNGKGGVEFYVASVKEGQVLFEVDGITEAEARQLFQRISYKLPVGTKFASRRFTKISE